MIETVAANPATASTWTSSRPPREPSLGMSPADMPSGNSTVSPSATGPAGAGQPTSRYSTVTASARPQPAAPPIAAHCMRSRSRAAAVS